MFVKTHYGSLLNLNNVSTIYITTENNISRVMAIYKDSEGNKREISLFRNEESQLCEQYLKLLSKKIAVM